MKLGQSCFALAQLLLQLGDFAVANAGGGFEIAVALRVVELGLLGVDLLLERLQRLDSAFFIFPLSGQAGILLLQVRKLLLDSLEPPAAGVVFFLLERLAFHAQLHDLAAKLVQLGGQRVILDPQPRGGLVDQIDRLVGQMAIGDVAMAERRGGDQGRVLDAHAVMGVVSILQAAQNCDGVLDARLGDEDGLETSFEGLVLLDLLAVFIECGRADATQLAAGEGRLEQIAGVGRTLGLAGSDDRVQLVDEENHGPIRFDDRVDDRL